jgi:hypothetical protein
MGVAGNGGRPGRGTIRHWIIAAGFAVAAFALSGCEAGGPPGTPGSLTAHLNGSLVVGGRATWR